MDKFSEAICAFANDMPNSRKNGYLIIGAHDDGKLSGLNVDDALLKRISAIRSDGNILPLPVMNVEKFKFKDFSLKTTQSATSIQQEVIGTIETEGFDSAYKVSFKSITPWQRNPTVSAYPMMGKLRVEYSNDTSTYLTLTALNTSSATYYAQKGSYVIADNLSLTWPQIIVSPAQYQLE